MSISNSGLIIRLVGLTALTSNLLACAPGFEAKNLSAISFSSQDLNLLSSAGGKIFSCSDPAQFSVTPMRRLTKAQYQNSLVALVGADATASVSSLIEKIQFDMAIEQPTDFVGNFVQTNINTFKSIADLLAQRAATDKALATMIGGACLASDAPSVECFKTVITNFGGKVFRRPLLANEVGSLQELVALGSSKTDQISALFEYLFDAPDFLYRLESGTGGDGTLQNPIQLTSYEIASRLSFLILDSMPDDTLFQLAAKDQLRDSAVAGAQVDRLFQSPLAQEKFKLFTSFWLLLNQQAVHGMKDFPSGPAAFVNGLDTNGYKDEVIRETKEFVNYIVFSKKGSYADLMTSNASFARTDALASVYGHAKVTSNTPESMTQRKGLLMRPIFLASPTSETNPIIRGVRMRSRILCNDLTFPGASVLTQGPDVSTTQMMQQYSTRERYGMKTSGASCLGCHTLINPYGYVFEGFDSFGRIRSQETNFNSDGSVLATHALNLQGSLQLDGANADVNGASQLLDDVASSTSGPACMTRQLFRFYELSAETSDDSCALAKAYNSMAQSGGSILDAVKSTIVNDYLALKRVN
jgi:hypothetical protein